MSEPATEPDVPRRGWTAAALALVAALAATGYAWGTGHARLHGYYAPAVQSMAHNWTAFLYGGYDPAASITIDKLPGAFMLQALSVRILGWHPWAVVLPQVIEAVLAVVVLYAAVRRWAGPVAGLVAAAALATTPIVAALARSQIADSLLVLLLILAAYAWQRAVDGARLGWLLLCGGWVGLAFQSKMVQAWAVLPAFGLGYLLAAPVDLRRRVVHLAALGGSALAVSMSWVTLVLLTPPVARPYVDGSLDDSPLSMVFQYNLLSRFGVTSDTSPDFGDPEPARSHTHWLYLLARDVSPQVGWLYPVAGIGLLAALWWSRRRPRVDPIRAGFVMWGTWLAVHAFAFTVGTVAHAYYVVALAPALAALAGGGLRLLWWAYRRGGWGSALLPVTVGLTAGWAGYLASAYPAFQPAVVRVALVGSLVAVMLLLAVAPLTPSRLRTGVAVTGAVTAAAAMLVPAGGWAAATVEPRYAGSRGIPLAGPNPQRDYRRAPTQVRAGTRALVGYLRGHQPGRRYLVAMDGPGQAGEYILAGASVLTMGGFTGKVPYPTTDELANDIAAGDLRYVVVPAKPRKRMRDARDYHAARSAWLTSHCRPVDPATYPSAGLTADKKRLYDCADPHLQRPGQR
jgi:4-amino-4-deoxy-L-arabinose transferase-like glycosyltransferase